MVNLFKRGKTTLGLVPGLALIFYNLWVPVEIPHSLLGGIVEAAGVSTLIVFYLKDSDLKKQSSIRLTRLGIIFCSLFLLSLLAYIVIFDSQNIYNSKYDITILMPFWKNQELSYMIIKAGSVNSAILQYGPEAIRKAIEDTPLAFSITKLIIIVTYVLPFEFLVIGFGFLAVKARNKTNFQNTIH